MELAAELAENGFENEVAFLMVKDKAKIKMTAVQADSVNFGAISA